MKTMAVRYGSLATLSLILLLSTSNVLSQNCAGLPAFPTSSITAAQDRDRMMCAQGFTFGTHPLRVEDPNRPVNATPPAANPETTNWSDPVRHTVTRGNWGQWITYDSPAGLTGGAMNTTVGGGVFGDYGPFSNPSYTPIDLLKMKAGDSVSLREDWWIKRRPEIFDLVKEQLYGNPIPLFPITWVVSGETTGTQTVNGVPYAYRQKTITGTVDISSYPSLRNTPRVTATCRFPAATGREYPVVITYGEGTGIFQYLAPYDIGTCSYTPTNVQADSGNSGAMSSYLIGLMNQGNWRDPDDAGSLVAWAWGISRLIDYFETETDFDADKVGVEGHSRYGKATLVTAAYDERVAVAWPSDAGALGTAMARRSYGETFEQVAGSSQEYHWLNGRSMFYGGPLVAGQYMPRRVELLDVDAHSTTSLVAPRAIFATNGTDTPPGFGDAWADPRGCFLSGLLAGPVWEHLGWAGQIIPPGTVFTSTLPSWQIHESIGGTPDFNLALIEGTVGWRRQSQGHVSAPNWPSFALFASRYLNDGRPVIGADQSFVLGDAPAGTVGVVGASDPDAADTIRSWQVKGGTGAYTFSIDSTTGTLLIVDPLSIDFVNTPSYTLIVMVGDGKLPAHDETVTITLPAKINVCHKNGRTLSISKGDVPDHVGHGDLIGVCGS